MVYVLLGEGFEEMEVIIPVGLLRRAKLEVALVTLDKPLVTGGQGMGLQADMTLADVKLDNMEMLVVPGGLGGVDSIRNSQEAMELIKKTWETDALIGAICAAPTILADCGITDGVQTVCYPAFEDKMGAAISVLDKPAIRDGRIITSKAAGTSFDFGLELVAALKGKEVADKIGGRVYYGG